MGTNFYFYTQNKNVGRNIFGYKSQIVDVPDFGYRLHLAKTSYGWLPLFEASSSIRSVADIEDVYKKHDSEIKIIDEDNIEYSWDEFVRRVIDHNGGTAEKRVRTLVDYDTYMHQNEDPDMPPWTPVSHFEYGKFGNHALYNERISSLYKDPDGYEFEEGEFC